jgi:hypothetical protein
MRNSPRFWVSISSLAILSLLALGLPGKPAFAADGQVVFVFGGDVEWSLNARPPTVRYRVADPTPYGKIVYGRRDVRDQVTGDWPPIPYVDQGESGAYLKSLGLFLVLKPHPIGHPTFLPRSTRIGGRAGPKSSGTSLMSPFPQFAA